MTEIQGSAERSLAQRKARDRAFVLPVVGLLLLTPPLAGIFELDFLVAGVPFTALYLFVVWAGLIAGAALLARTLRDHASSRNPAFNASNDENDSAAETLERHGFR